MSDKNDVVIINLDRPRVLRYGHLAMKKLGALTGKDIDNMDMDNFDPEELEKIIYCGLLTDAKEHNETLKLEDMEDLLDKARSYGDIIEKMELAFNAAFGNLTDEKN
jgi:hypothetical protein